MLSKTAFFLKKWLAIFSMIGIIGFVDIRKEFYDEQRRISSRDFKKS